MRWRFPAATGLASAALLTPIGASADAPRRDPGTPTIELISPSSEERIRNLVPLALLEGRIGGPQLFDSDVFLAIDQSNSALLASGLDVDSDGTLGRSRTWAKEGGGKGTSHQRWTSDSGDTVLAAELALARALVEGLGARGNRIGVLTFTDAVRVRAELGEPAAARTALAGIRPVVDWTGTNHARALAVSDARLASAGGGRGIRPRAILLFSDGRPTAPDAEHWATKRALQTARELGERGVVIYTVAFGEDSDPVYLDRLAQASGGALLSQRDLRALASEPRRLRMPPPELVVENLTASSAARAIRVLPDGSFDAVVPLVDGENVLEVRALFADGLGASVRTSVRYERPDPGTEADRRDLARWLILLRERTREIGSDLPAAGGGR